MSVSCPFYCVPVYIASLYWNSFLNSLCGHKHLNLLCLTLTTLNTHICIYSFTPSSVFGDYFLARAILLTSPSVAAVGLGLGTPLAIFIDIVLGTEGAVNTLSIIGGLLVVAGFLVLQLDDDQVKAIMISLGCGRGQAPAR